MRTALAWLMGIVVIVATLGAAAPRFVGEDPPIVAPAPAAPRRTPTPAAVTPGMTMAEVRAVLGQPDGVGTIRGAGRDDVETWWDYTHGPTVYFTSLRKTWVVSEVVPTRAQ